MGMFRCAVEGCKKTKFQKHTHTLGSLSRSEADRRLIEDYRIHAEMTGMPANIPGGSASDMNHYMTQRLKEGSKQAKNFRKNLKK